MLPAETIAAAFPPAVGCGGARIGPAAMAHIAALDAIGVRWDELTEETAPVAAWILSLAPERLADVVNPPGDRDARAAAAEEMGGWMRRNGIGRKAALAAAAECLRQAFAPYVPVANGGRREVQLNPRGYGWPVEMAEALMSRYGMTFSEAMSEPLCRVFAVMAAGNAAAGCGGGPDYYERIQIAAIRRAKVESLRRELETAERRAEEGGGVTAWRTQT